MKQNSTANLDTKTPMQEEVEMLGEYLGQHYEFRKNSLSDKFEVRMRMEMGGKFVPVTREVINSISLSVKRDGLEIKSVKQLLEEMIFSDDTPVYDPINDFLRDLPEWDGQNHIGALFGRIPGLTTELQYFASIWLRSTVAHWMGMDDLHGNECVITLIGEQGCGKSTWCARILPPELRVYFLDHLNLGNKFDKEMALTSNLLVNIDELDQIRPTQQSQLKQLLSKIKVNGRPIFGKAQEDRRRYASFVATTNNPRPLTDPTGSRRFICIKVPDGMLIDNATDIDYPQLYAQIVYELKVKGMRYWFNSEEVKRIQGLNAGFQQVTDLGGMVDLCFRHPEEGEEVKALTSGEIISHIKDFFPMLKQQGDLTVKLGMVLKSKSFERKNYAGGRKYMIVPIKAA